MNSLPNLEIVSAGNRRRPQEWCVLPIWLHWDPLGASEKYRLVLEVFPESSFSY